MAIRNSQDSLVVSKWKTVLLNEGFHWSSLKGKKTLMAEMAQMDVIPYKNRVGTLEKVHINIV